MKMLMYGVVGVVIVVLAAIFFIGPSITGFSTFQKVKSSGLSMDDFASDLGKLRDQVTEKAASLQKCDEFSQELFTKVDNFDDQIAECNNKLQGQIAQAEEQKQKMTIMDSEIRRTYDDQLAALREDNEDISEELNELKDEYDKVIADAANKICCTKKLLEDSKIKYYDVEGNKIVCKVSEGTEISC